MAVHDGRLSVEDDDHVDVPILRVDQDMLVGPRRYAPDVLDDAGRAVVALEMAAWIASK